MALPTGNARSQFQLVQKQVETERGKGVFIRTIFEALRAEGKISMVESTFYKHVAKALKTMPNSPDGGAIVPPTQETVDRPTPPRGPIKPHKPEDRNRFRMNPKIPDYD